MDITVALRQITEPGPELQALFVALNRELEAQGIKVILLPARADDGILLQLWNVDVAIALTQVGRTAEGPPGDSSIHFYYSCKRRQESLAVIAAIVQEMLLGREIVSYSLARSWDFLKQYRYYRLIRNSGVPLVLMELHHFRLTPEEIERLTGWIVNGVINHYGRRGDDTTQEEPERTPLQMEEEPTPEDGGEASDVPSPPPEEVEAEPLPQEGEAVAESLMEEQTPTRGEERSHEGDAASSREAPLLPVEGGSTKAGVPSPPKQVKAPAPGKQRYWGTNPLSPPGDGPVYFFKRQGTPELPPSRIDPLRLQLMARGYQSSPRAAAIGGKAAKPPSLPWAPGCPHRVLPGALPDSLEPRVSSSPENIFAELKGLAASLPGQREAPVGPPETNKAP
ncbi:hypothetical protein [Thermanaeromonas sp. C210]|uniref:hypothetical protein n=1 Tax=Thermanaeromonas sp. C210 TaxID=2731925 RepID=UPI00155CB94D|nr:hypothetical protein [Thermanaeromonas sp. C210]GFN23732.1 hypothetical protein TAMC210_20490 [Thermanaeromonas sp. C210]